jgi:spoIIIJ-associated protein
MRRKMNLTYKIKANSKEEAISKIIDKHNIKKEDIIETIELLKPTSFFGFFKKEGEYEVKIDSETEIDIEKIETEVERNEEIKENLEEKVIEKAKELLVNMGLSLELEVLEAREHYILINLSGEDNGIIIGKKGKTLNSFEYLLNSLCKNVKVEVDVEGFKAKRAETLRDLARKMAEKAIKTERTVKLNPMPPRERKIIHEIVNKYKELDTYSEGRDPKRYIVIKKKRMG